MEKPTERGRFSISICLLCYIIKQVSRIVRGRKPSLGAGRYADDMWWRPSGKLRCINKEFFSYS